MRELSNSISRFIHRHFLKLLLGTYGIAVFLPQWGQAIRLVHLGRIDWWDHSTVTLTLPMLMLSFLLFNAGLGIKVKELARLHQKPALLISGLAANLLIPIGFILLFHFFSGRWHNPQEVQNLMVGLALVAAMPIAGSSTAWSQNANGNLVLSLGLVVLSTMLSPWTTPMVLHFFGLLTTGDFSEDLHELAANGVNAFLSLTVVIPSLLGILCHFLLGEKRTEGLKPFLKILNYANLLLLSYSNAALSLPKALLHPDWDFLLFIVFTAASLCALAFLGGWALARVFRSDPSERAALMFGLGMNNNGTGLVLSSMALADHPNVMLPVIFYTLAQQIIAGIVSAWI